MQTHLTVRFRWNVAAAALGAEVQARRAGLLPGDSVAAEEVLLAGHLAGHVAQMVGIVVDGALGLHAVHVLGEVTAIRPGVVLEAIVALPQDRTTVVAHHVLGAGALVTKGGEVEGLTGGKAVRLAGIHAALAGSIELVGPFALQFYGLASWGLLYDQKIIYFIP